MSNLIKLVRIQRELQMRKLTPEVGIYRRWIKELIKQAKGE